MQIPPPPDVLDGDGVCGRWAVRLGDLGGAAQLLRRDQRPGRINVVRSFRVDRYVVPEGRHPAKSLAISTSSLARESNLARLGQR